MLPIVNLTIRSFQFPNSMQKGKRKLSVICLFTILMLGFQITKAQVMDTVNHTYFTNHHPKIKSKYMLYLVFQMSNCLKPKHIVSFNERTLKYDTTKLHHHDFIHDSIDKKQVFYYHPIGFLQQLGQTHPQSILLLDEHHKIIGIDILKAKEIEKLAEMYATPSPDDMMKYKIRYYKLTGIAVYGVGDVKKIEVNNPMIRMSCHDKKKYYSEHGINGQHAMLGY